MAIVVRGNLALKEEESRKNAKRTQREKAKKPVIPAAEKWFYLGAILLCMVIAGAVLYQSAQLYSVNTRIQDIEREIQMLEKENEQLKLEGERLREPQRLYELGKALGFQAPEEEDVIPVSPDKHIITSAGQNTAYLD